MNTVSWQPSASISFLKKRVQLIARIRDFFNQREYLEVETPIMGRFGVSDVYLSNIKGSFRGKDYALQTSPEYHMKRLLAAGSGSIFQLARVFRDDELGRWHNPEFTMLEWYRLDFDANDLMKEVDDFLQYMLNCEPALFLSYKEIFMEYANLNPFSATIPELKQALNTFNLQNILPETEEDCDQYLFLLMTHVIEPVLAKHNRPVAIYNFPPSQAALAQVSDGVAHRFEFYYKGVELANGFHELLDHDLQMARFNQDLEKRKMMHLEHPELDCYLLAALKQGLPPCSGVALGVDRLLALAMEMDGIAATLAFDFSRA